MSLFSDRKGRDAHARFLAVGDQTATDDAVMVEEIAATADNGEAVMLDKAAATVGDAAVGDKAAPTSPTPYTAIAPFTASRQLEVMEHFRVPYIVTGNHVGRGLEHVCSQSGAMLLWPRAAQRFVLPVAASIDLHSSASIRVFGRIVADHVAQQLLSEHGGVWSRVVAITGDGGRQLGSIWRAADGSVFLPFDPDEVCHNYWSEQYTDLLPGGSRGMARRSVTHAYYLVRGLLPRAAQLWLRRRYARIQARASFPSWPAETGLHDYFDLFLSILAGVAGGPIPYIAPWPHGYDWALVLTHDVETSKGLEAMQPILDLERALDLRSSWNFVPRRYPVRAGLVRGLLADGFEVGVHGLYHDGRDLKSLPGMLRRLPEIREAAERWNAVGFRSPASHRNWDWMPLLGFQYDSSYPDTDPYEPQPGGCCSWLPFFNQGMVELPLTMPHDHNLFVILGHKSEKAWIDKAELLRERAGMALIVTHPDYLIDPRIMDSYQRFLERYAVDERAWKVLPQDVNNWWRRRAASRVAPVGDGWSVTGPAEGEARVAFVENRAWS